MPPVVKESSKWKINPENDVPLTSNDYVVNPTYNQRYEAATGSTDFETIKKLNRKQQMEMIKSMKVSRREMSKLKNAKEEELINWIIENNKEQ